MIEKGKQLLEGRNKQSVSLKSDCGTAIIGATKRYRITHKPCYTHSLRKGGTRGGGYRSGKGSALRYLKDLVSVGVIVI